MTEQRPAQPQGIAVDQHAPDPKPTGPDPGITRPDPAGLGRRQPAHGVSQEHASNAMATHPNEVGGTKPVLPPRPNPDEPRRA